MIFKERSILLKQIMQQEDTHRGLLISGFFVLSLSIIIAHINPATQYELSIYTGTPLQVWIGVAFTLLIAIVLAFNTTDKIQKCALLLAGSSVLLIIALPLIRGYYHVGEGDSMTHVGMVKDLSTDVIGVIEAGYPAVHLLSLTVVEIVGIPIPQSFHLIVILFLVLFFIFIPLVVRYLAVQRLSVLISVFVGFMLLPINHISIHMTVHPTSQAILFMALFLYVFITYVERKDYRYVILFGLCALSLLLLHPQQAANFLIFLSAAASIQLISEFAGDSHLHRSLYLQTSVFFVVFWAWFSNTRFGGALVRVLEGLLINDQPSAEEVSERGGSVVEVGSSVLELALKLFSVSFLFSLLAGGFMAIVTFHYFKSKNNDENNTIIYLIFGFIPVTGMFFIYIVASITTQYLRHVGFMMVIVTVLGAIGLGRLITWLDSDERTARRMATVVVIALLATSLLVIFPSPYILQGSGHVPEKQISGYEVALDNREEGVTYLNIRSGIGRYLDFTEGISATNVEGERAPDHFGDQDLSSHYKEPRYLTVTAADRHRDPILYQGFRYSREDFQYLETDPNISHVQSNGGFDLYYITGSNEPETDSISS